MTLLLSNDDGVTAAGLRVLYKQLAEKYNCHVVAPDNDCSGVGSCITLDRPLRVKQHENGFVSVNGTPTDAVHLGVNCLMEQQPERVVSGINLSANLGDDVLYSGTVAAAMEGRFMEKAAIAISSCGKSEENLVDTARVLMELFPKLESMNLPDGTILNINVPAVPYADIKGVRIARLGHRHRANKPQKVIDPRGNEGWWISTVGKAMDAGEGTDFHAIANGFVSVTPLQYDKTDHKTLSLVGKRLGTTL